MAKRKIPLKIIDIRPGGGELSKRDRISIACTEAARTAHECSYQGKRVKYGSSIGPNATMVVFTAIIPDRVIKK